MKHSLKFYFTGSFGIPDVPEFVGAVDVDQIWMAYCDSNKRIKPKQDWVKKVIQNDREQLDWYKEECFVVQPNFFKTTIENLMQRFNQRGGVHILQRMSGCEWDDETGEGNGFMHYGYDGEDFISLNVKNLTWIALKPRGVATKLSWDADKITLRHYENYLTHICPQWLKKYVDIARSSLLRKDFPSVSLLQKSPSSPVSCFATGFYPDKAVMFWRKDGEELQEDVDHGEILSNHDGSFQMSVDLNISSVSSEDWGRYECVFQLSGVEDKIFTKLETMMVNTNWGRISFLNHDGLSNTTTLVIVVMVVILGFFAIAAVGFIVYRKRRADRSRDSTENSPELSELTNSQIDPQTH
ncbi:major histocompatibility complex class I-related gene protein-like isoform X2 [Cheilinus undulatus]|uniref:major histocompatibility complex class I-related gene protein-like isoform X2 n=1 Tax=Cheilinus undulatus TaxID=241271 RepID=UPI001BD5CB85|nr:major histocompatibility complex class I-related gene protein-like isoform X2 [Cheilinus undulatus]